MTGEAKKGNKEIGVIRLDAEGHEDFLKQLQALENQESARYYDYGKLVAQFNQIKPREVVHIEMPKAKKMFLIERLGRAGLTLNVDYSLTIITPDVEENGVLKKGKETAFIVRVSEKQGSTAPIKRGPKAGSKKAAAAAAAADGTPQVGQLQAQLPDAQAASAAAAAEAPKQELPKEPVPQAAAVETKAQAKPEPKAEVKAKPAATKPVAKPVAKAAAVKKVAPVKAAAKKAAPVKR